MRPWKKNNLTFTLKKRKKKAQGVNKYFHEIYLVKQIFEESVKRILYQMKKI